MATLTSQFRAINNDIYDIRIISDLVKSDSTFVLGKDPLHFVMPESDDKYPGVRTIEAEINILTQNNLSFLYSDDPLNVRIEVRRNGTLIFFGYLEPSEWQQPLVPGEYNDVQIVAMDALGALRNVREYRRMLMLGQGSDQYGNPSLITRMGEILNESLTYNDMTGQSVMSEYFSTEAFIGTDLDDTEAYTTYGDMLSGFCRAAGVTMMMTGRTINVYRVDDQPEGYYSLDLMTILSRNNLDMKIVPPVRRVVAKYDKMPDFEPPKFTSSFAYPMTYNTDRKLFCLVGSGTWQPYGKPSEWATLNAALFTTATDSNNYGEPFAGVGALQQRTACHIFVPYAHPSLSVTAELHFNDWRGSDELSRNRMSLYPDDAVCNTWVEQLNTAQTINLYIGESVRPDSIDNTYGLDRDLTTNERYDIIKASKWGACSYTFPLDGDKVASCNGYVQLQVRSYPQPTSQYEGKQFAPRFARNIRLRDDYYKDKTFNVDAAGTQSLSEMDFGSPLFCGESYLLGSCGHTNITGRKSPDTHKAMQTLAAQYRNAHIMWTADFRANVINYQLPQLINHYIFQGKRHTVMSCDWDVRQDSVELVLLEDYKQ